MRKAAAGVLSGVLAGAAQAAEPATAAAEAGAVTPRETFLAAAVGAMMAAGLASFFLGGRVSERTHVALAMLVVLIGAFVLLILFGSAGRNYPVVGALVVLGLVALFKLMNQFEIRQKPGASGDRPVTADRTPPPS